MIRSALKPTLDTLLAPAIGPVDDRMRMRGQLLREDNRRWARLGRLEMINKADVPVRFFWIIFVPTTPEMASLFLVNRPTLRLWLARQLQFLEIRAAVGMEALRRALDIAREAARDRCRSALDRGLALIALDALLALVATLAVEALNLIRAIPPPMVASSGGRTGLHAPLN